MMKLKKIMSNSFSMLLIIGVSLTIVFLLFKEPILWAFGASETTINYALDYLTIYVMGTLFVQIALGMNPFIKYSRLCKNWYAYSFNRCCYKYSS